MHDPIGGTGPDPDSGGAHRPRPGPPEPGLHFIATPIGAARDITLRALDLLASADVLAAEDTRSLRRLMEIHGVALNRRRVLAYHDHNGAAMRPKLLAELAAGRSVVYASEAGTPLIADPGYQLARAAIAAGHVVRAAPGPSAVLAALTVSGLASDRFLFAGFAPSAAKARARWLAELADVPATLIVYESPKRVRELLAEMVRQFGEDREAAVCRELTKKFEETVRGRLGNLALQFAEGPVRGEVVVVVGQAAERPADPAEMEKALMAALNGASVKEAAASVAKALGLPRRDVYQAALRLAGRQ